MLTSLYIKNYALIDDVSISFQSGFSVITGETGAGKSILLGALSLLLGKRADMNVLRDESSKCIVEGIFNLKQLDARGFFEFNDLDYDDNTLVRREIIPSGKSRAFINDTPVKLNLLKELGDKLIDIHSQHETLELGRSQFQLNVLDHFIEEPELPEKYAHFYSKYITLKTELEKSVRENEQAKRDEDYFRFQFEELKAAGLSEGEDERLIEREKLLSHAEEVIKGVGELNRLLSDDDMAVLDRLKEVENWLQRIGKYLPGIESLSKRVSSARIELEDIANEVGKMSDLADFDPNELNKISERLNAIYKLQQKHQVQSVEDLLQLQNDYAEKLNDLKSGDDIVEQLRSKLVASEKETKNLALQIHNYRMKGAEKLASAVKNLLSKLGMKEAGFEVSVKELETMNPTGIDKVTFLFNANNRDNLLEISNVASGGELSRLMLAVKSLVTKEQLLPTVIFDEIDAGVSGEIAGKVGNIIKEMSQHHQVIAITHLPQIAAKSDIHFRVFKTSENRIAKTKIAELSNTERVEEIAKLLSDEKVSASAINTAKELLKV